MLWNERADTRRRSIAADGGRAKQNREDGADSDPAGLPVTLRRHQSHTYRRTPKSIAPRGDRLARRPPPL